MDDSAADLPRFGFVVLDTDEPDRLADFYAALLGWQVLSRDEDWVSVGDGGPTRLAFQLAVDYRPPTWPADDVPQQFHLDLYVDDLDRAGARAESLGARRAPVKRSSGSDFVVFLDPSGHPFCLCLSGGEGAW